ncbi:MAG TPA: DUF1566 domain-containing protein [Methyloprofundus sp.]|nr:DUF1566 domain-containing protein [Methyloprofundus sp.]HIL77386.1 DUF1566 domain-containing protein [Methylococcales bacterium]
MVFLKSALLVTLLWVLSISLFNNTQSIQQQYKNTLIHQRKIGAALAWQYCRPTSIQSCPEPLLLNWGQALRYCAQLEWKTYSDWRLPSRTELLSLVNRQKRTPAINEHLAHDTKDTVYWTSNTDFQHPELAYYISFFSGNSYANSKQIQAYARCVRKG